MTKLIQYAMSFIGTQYKWGGENPITGFDCSGFVQEVLRSCGMDPVGDQSAQALFNAFKQNLTDAPSAGCICFYGKSQSEITHVAFAIDSLRMVEAGGGGSLTITKEDAAAKNAFVRMRPIAARKDLVALVLPNYPLVRD